MKYDIIVFENYRQAKHHKIDVRLIAKLLKAGGLSVAILDIYHEDRYDELDDIPVLHHHVILPKILNANFSPNPMKRFIEHLYYYRAQDIYFTAVLDEVREWAGRFYCGSYHLGMSASWFSLKKPCFWWGLRSNRFKIPNPLRNENRYTFFRAPFLRNKFLRNPYQFLFVSNNIIKKEFLSLGLPEERLIIREERVVEEDMLKHRNPTDVVSFLTIGQLRPQKRVDLSIKAFKRVCDNSQLYYVIGKANEDYEKIIQSNINGYPCIVRNNCFLEYEEFLEYYSKSHFVIFADMQTTGTITNGTMLEALIHYCPIIAPCYNPYAYYIDKYKIGIKYNPDVDGDLEKAMMTAIHLGCKSFEKPIKDFLSTISFESVSRDLSHKVMSV